MRFFLQFSHWTSDSSLDHRPYNIFSCPGGGSRVIFKMMNSAKLDASALKAIFASMQHGVVFIDDRDRITYCNPAAEKIRDIRLEDVHGQSILECHPAKSHSKVLHIIDDLRSGRVIGHHRMNIQMVKGRFYDNTYCAVRGPKDEFLGVVVVTQEVTERKKMEDDLKEALRQLQHANEALTRLNRTKDDFLSTVSHELKTPMISVVGYIGMILNEKVGPLTEQQRRFLDISYKNLLKLEKNINNLIDLAEFGIIKETWVFEAVDLCKVIAFSCLTLEPLAREHDIRLETHLPSEPVVISGIPDKLNQLFDNLLTNAIKYNRREGNISVGLSQTSDRAFVHISDTGIGISHQSLKEVFTRHFQEKTKPLGNMKGLGIGLSLVQEIVNLHKGEIQLQSEVGKGTTFIVMLPLAAQKPR